MNTNRTTDEIFSPTEHVPSEEHATRFVDVHIYDYESEREELPSIESQPGTPDESDQQDTEPTRPHQKHRVLIPLCVGGLLCIIGLSAFIAIQVFPLFAPEATITIVPNTQQIRTTTRITVTTGRATGTQLQGRALAAITMNQARTVATTGEGHQDAKAGQGYITFYNAAPYPQTVPAGTLLTGADGIQVVTDQDATIAAVQYPTLGQTTITAHATMTGPASNIAAGDIYGPCCRLNVSAVSSTFTGGQQARDYPTVMQQDITTVAARLTTSLNQSVQAALQTQVQSDETLITPLPCQQSVNPDHQPGAEAAQVTILVSETCTGMTYQTQALHTLVTQIITQQASKQLGDRYTLQGAVQASINSVSRKGHEETLQTTIAATWGYQFTQERQVQIKAQIAGKQKDAALQTLLHMPGVQTVSIDSKRIPTNVSHIHIVFLVTQ